MTKQVTYGEAVTQAHGTIQSILTQMNQPFIYSNQKSLDEHNAKLYLVLKEITEITQDLLLKYATSGMGLQADPEGWTKAKTCYDHIAMTSKFKYAHLVNANLRKILDEQTVEARNEGSPMTKQAVINAQLDAVDNTKDEVFLETVQDTTTGVQQALSVSKDGGDAQMYEKKDGVWVKVGNVVKGYWQGIKDFALKIWQWLAAICVRFKNWVVSFFKTPSDADVVLAKVA